MTIQRYQPPGEGMSTRAAAVALNSFNADDNTVQVTWTTGARGVRSSWRVGDYDEELSTDSAHVRLDRLNRGAPVLNAHQGYDIAGQIGVVVDGSARMDRGQGVATLRLSRRPELAAIVADIAGGIIRNLSVGYRVHAYEITEPDGSRPLYRAIDWEPYEISFVPMPFDPGAQVRAGNPSQEATMTTPTTGQPGNDTPPAPITITARGVTLAARNAGLDAVAIDELMERHEGQPYTRETLMADVGRRFAARDSQAMTNGRIDPFAGHGGVAQLAERIEGALVARMGGTAPDDASREYMGMSLARMAREMMNARGEDHRRMSDIEIVQRGMNTSSDFYNLLIGGGRRYLAAAFEAAQSEVMTLSRERTAQDFRDLQLIALDEAGPLPKVNEAGEYRFGTFNESVERFRLASFGRIFRLSRQALINDDLNAFSDPLRLMARAVAETEANEVTALLTANGGMGAILNGDAKTLYHADHKNVAAAGSALSVDSLGAGRQGMRDQKDRSGKVFTNAVPKHLLVGTALETKAEQLLATLAAETTANVNPFSGKLGLKVDPRMPGTSWRLFADPATHPVIEHAYLSGQKGPRLDTREGFYTDHTEFKVALDFGAGVTDWRGTWLNPGG